MSAATATASKVANVGLIGNPNTGKTSLFNALTGLRQKVGNYPGITVERKEGRFSLPGGQLTNLVDLPGTYSLAASSPDERVVVDALSGNLSGPPFDAIICVVDAGNIQRNLFLASQIADLGLPVVIALNLWDEAEKKGWQIDVNLLSERLNTPVVPTVAKRGIGISELRGAVERALREKPQMQQCQWPEAVHVAEAELRKALPADASLIEAEIRRLLFDANSAISDRLGWSAEERRQHLSDARGHLRNAGWNPLAAEALVQFEHIRELIADAVVAPGDMRRGRSESIDNLLIHRFWGLAVFVGLMYLVFQSVYTWAGPFMGAIESFIGWIQGGAASLLAGMPTLQSLVVDGVIGGVGAFLVFLPQILILFFFIALLEDTGYMARAAFLMDKLFSWCGLNGKSFVPMLSSYACAIPGIMAARTINDPKARLTTILISPLMSCSARLPVYVLLIGAFIQPHYGAFWAGFTLFVMHFVGLLVAIPVAFILTRFVFRTQSQPFILELPPYRVPRLRDVGLRMWRRGQDFVKTAGTIIFAMTIIIWALLYFPRPTSVEENVHTAYATELASQEDLTAEEALAALDDPAPEVAEELELRTEAAYIEQSALGRFGKFIQPVFAPAGFDWKITVGVVSSFPAREVIISTLGIIYSLGGDVDEESGDLRSIMQEETWPAGTSRAGQPVYTVPVVLAVMVFFALCMQCGATVAVMAREASAGYAVAGFVYMTVLAWIGAVLTYQVGSLFL